MKNKSIFRLLLIAILAITLVGCETKEKDDEKGENKVATTQKIKCSKEEIDEDGYKTTENMIVTTKDNKVKNVSSTSIIEMDPEYIEFTISFGEAMATEFNKVEGMEMKYEKDTEKTLKMTLSVDYDKLDPEQMKEVLGELYEEDESSSLYHSKDMTFEEFKKESLEGYTCDE